MRAILYVCRYAAMLGTHPADKLYSWPVSVISLQWPTCPLGLFLWPNPVLVSLIFFHELCVSSSQLNLLTISCSFPRACRSSIPVLKLLWVL